MLLIASKHLDMCGCTARGSLVWERISNSSSLDKKKNLAAEESAAERRYFACKCGAHAGVATVPLGEENEGIKNTDAGSLFERLGFDASLAI